MPRRQLRVAPSALGGARILRRRSRRGPGYEELEGSRTSRCPPWEWNGPSWVLTLPLPQPPARAQGPPLSCRLPRSGFQSRRSHPLLSVPARHLAPPARSPRLACACASPQGLCACAWGSTATSSRRRWLRRGDFFFSELREIRSRHGLHQQEPCARGLRSRPGSPPAAGLRGPGQRAPGLPPTPGRTRIGAAPGEGGRRPAAQARSWPRPGAGAGAGAQTAFRPPRSPLGDGGPGSLGSALRANISSGTCASAPSGIVSEVNVRAACTWTPGGSSMKILYAPYVSAPEDALSRPPQPRNEENGSPRRNSLSRA